jgi:hypothetical protein
VGRVAAVRGSAEVPHRQGCAAIALPAVRPVSDRTLGMKVVNVGAR